MSTGRDATQRMKNRYYRRQQCSVVRTRQSHSTTEFCALSGFWVGLVNSHSEATWLPAIRLMQGRYFARARGQELAKDPWHRMANAMSVAWRNRRLLPKPDGNRTVQRELTTWYEALIRMQRQADAMKQQARPQNPWKKWARAKLNTWKIRERQRLQRTSCQN